MDEELFLIGRIVGFHGVKGEIKIAFDNKRSFLWAHLKTIFLIEEDTLLQESLLKQFDIQAYRFHKSHCLIQLKGYASKNAVEPFLEYKVYAQIPKETFLTANEYLTEDLTGMKVINQHGQEVGRVLDSVSLGKTGDSLMITNTQGEKRYIPFVEALVPQVNLEEQYILINDIPGLIFDEV